MRPNVYQNCQKFCSFKPFNLNDENYAFVPFEPKPKIKSFCFRFKAPEVDKLI